MKLVEQGKLALDRPANDYLGEARITGLAGDASGVTVQRLLSHTSGLPLHYRFFYEGSSIKRPTMDEAIARYAITVYPPGKVYSDRVNLTDLRFGKILNYKGTRTNVALDLLNLFNINTPTGFQQNYTVPGGGAFMTPTVITSARVAKINITVDF